MTIFVRGAINRRWPGFGGSLLHIWDLETFFELENNPSTHLLAWIAHLEWDWVRFKCITWELHSRGTWSSSCCGFLVTLPCFPTWQMAWSSGGDWACNWRLLEPSPSVVRGSWSFPVGVHKLDTLVKLVAWRISILCLVVRRPPRARLLIVD
jgi:hypothetical protein